MTESAEDFLQRLQTRRLKERGLSAADIDELIKQRQQARQDKDFEKADALRDQLSDMGVEMMDRGGVTHCRIR